MELWCRQMKYHSVPWNSMELWDCHFMAFHPGWTSKGYSMEFHGTLESPNKKSPSSMGFHGIRRAPFQMTQIFHGIPWNIPWNSMALWCREMKYHLVPWNSMELWDCHFITCYSGLPWNIPWNSTELWNRQIKNHKKNHRDPWDSKVLGGRHFKWHMFYGIPCYFPWKSGVAQWSIT